MDNEVIPQVNISSEHGLRKIDFIDNDLLYSTMLGIFLWMNIQTV